MAGALISPSLNGELNEAQFTGGSVTARVASACSAATNSNSVTVLIPSTESDTTAVATQFGDFCRLDDERGIVYPDQEGNYDLCTPGSSTCPTARLLWGQSTQASPTNSSNPSVLEIYFESQVAVTTPGGSDFSAVIGKPFCEHGNYDVPGTGGDFPAGEVGFGPKTGSVNGHIVYDVKVQHIGVLNEALHLQVENDRVCEASGPAADRFHEICVQRGDILRFISEISIGLNPFAGVSAAPAYIPEEKTFGTLHCGHGGNASYGERKGPHIDGVMAKPTLVVGGRKLMQDGVMPAGLIEESSRKWLAQEF